MLRTLEDDAYTKINLAKRNRAAQAKKRRVRPRVPGVTSIAAQ